MADNPRITITITDEVFASALKYADQLARNAYDEHNPGLVYFIGTESGASPIKIGFTLTIEKRLPTIRRQSPVAIDLIACAPGARQLESHYHSLFCNERLHGEWFKPSERLLGECRRLAALWIG